MLHFFYYYITMLLYILIYLIIFSTYMYIQRHIASLNVRRHILLSHKVHGKYTHLILYGHASNVYTVVKDTWQCSVLPQLNVAISKTSFPSVILSCDIKYLQQYGPSFVLKLGKPFCTIRTRRSIKDCNILHTSTLCMYTFLRDCGLM